MGQAFAAMLHRRGLEFENLTRAQLDYSRFPVLLEYLRNRKPSFLINAAGFTGKPNVDACETAKADTLLGNVTLPLTVGQACSVAGVPWGHVSSGCIYSGAWVEGENGSDPRVEKDLTTPEMRHVLARERGRIRGFTEVDAPNFSFRSPPCSFYSGTKALAEEALLSVGGCYIWRLRIPFDEIDSARNYLSKVQRYAKVYDNANSVSHRADFVGACLGLHEVRAPFGIYNITNPGFLTTREVIGMVESILKPARPFEFWENDEDFYRQAGRTPRSNCVMDVSKLLAAGVPMRPVEEAMEHALRNWTPERA